jgi:nicotinate-nucleotide adenylyltransferase
LLGGSFDPVHNGHLALARSALQQLKLDEVRWLPAGSPWQKSDRVLAAPVHRREMVRIAIHDEPRFVLDPREMQRDGPTYTIDTVRSFQTTDPNLQLVLILGVDQYQQLPTWHEWRELLASVTVAVAARSGQAVRPRGALVAVWHRLELLAMPEVRVSSTEIRARVTAGEPIEGLVPDGVARYIAQHKLYRGDAGV